MRPDGTASIHSHTISGSNALENRNGFCTSATYLGPTSVVVSDSTGRLGVMEQAL